MKTQHGCKTNHISLRRPCVMSRGTLTHNGGGISPTWATPNSLAGHILGPSMRSSCKLMPFYTSIHLLHLHLVHLHLLYFHIVNYITIFSNFQPSMIVFTFIAFTYFSFTFTFFLPFYPTFYICTLVTTTVVGSRHALASPWEGGVPQHSETQMTGKMPR